MRHEVPEPWASAMIKEGITDPRNGTRPSWREMARRTGVHPTTLIAMASGERATKPGVVEAVATALRMSPQTVSGWVGIERSEWRPYAPPDEANLLDRNERDAVDTVVKLLARPKRVAALGRYLQAEMDARGWRQTDLARASGLSKQTISLLLNQDLKAMIKQPTIEALARGLEVDESIIISKAAEAIGVPVDKLAPVKLTADDVSDDVLIEILRKRLAAARPAAPVESGNDSDTTGEFAEQTATGSATNAAQAVNGDGNDLGVEQGWTMNIASPDSSHEKETDVAEPRGQPAEAEATPPVV